MLMNKITKYSLGALMVAIAGSCSLSTKMDATIDREVEATTQLKETAKIPDKALNDDVVRVKNDIWLGDSSQIEYEGQPIPSYLEGKDGITLISNRPITLYEIGDMINKITGMRVSYATHLEKEVLSNGAKNKPTAQAINADWTDPSKMLVSYQGPLSGLLNEIGSRFGIWWKYDRKEIYFYKFVTRTFVLYTLPSTPSLSVNVGGSSQGSGGSSSISLQSSTKMDFWKNIETAIKNMLDKDSKYTMDPSNGTITVSATPNDIKKVAKYINEQNTRLSRQVAISVKVLQVSIDDSDQYGLDLSAVWKSPQGESIGVSSIAGGLGQDVTKNLTMTLLPGNVTVNGALQALSTQGTTNLITSGTVTTLNNKPAPIQVVKSRTIFRKLPKPTAAAMPATMTFRQRPKKSKPVLPWTFCRVFWNTDG